MSRDHRCGHHAAEIPLHACTAVRVPKYHSVRKVNTEVLFAGSDRFQTKEVVRGVQAAAAEGGPTRDTTMGVSLRDSEGLYRVPWPQRDLGAGRGRLSEEATVGVCPPRGDRTPRG